MTSPKLRFKEFDGDWSKVSLDKISKVFDGTHQTPNYVESGIKFVSVENIQSPYDSDKFITAEAFKKDFKNKPQLNDILMTRITAGEIGATAIVNDSEPLAYYVSLALIRPKANVSTPFLNQYIGTPFFKNELHKRIIHVAFPKKINLGDINECLISLPNKQEEQIKIASFLSVVDEKINQLTEKHELLSQYKQGMMQKLFSQQIRFKADDGKEFGEWEEKFLKEFFPKIRNGFVGVATPYYVESGVKYLQGKNIKNGKIDATGLIYINNEFHQKKTNSILHTNDILMVQSGHVGECAVVTDEYKNGNCHALLVLTPKSSQIVNSEFVVYYFYSEFGKKKITLIKTGNTIEHILASDIKEVSMLFPCIEEQTQIANFLSAIDQKIEVVALQIEQAKQWKKGLLQQMFV
ncbi:MULTISPECIES: restriction endonuclease subunit S [unclassified Acinetobacter]|uniref:restriction endonuclease subunit S n=1 Tax=unclassified Acinetobacter TaxID=196816 RepID=UPI0015D4071F|nr:MULTISPECIES: restriction endonuclease subunit S [unclassified Acinetobacter]